MAKYILVKKVKGQKFEYQVIDTESKAIVSKRTSARDYVACTADGSEFPEGFRDIESDYNQSPGEPYPTIAINDTGNPERMIEFYVTGKQYDVYHLAFKGFIKG